MSEILEGLEGVICHMDDICVWGASLQQHDPRVRSVLNRLKDAGITLNVSKCEFAVDRIRFLGHVISSTGVCANPDAVQGLNAFKTPECVGDVRSFLGMANQLGKFSEKLSAVSQPLRDLLCKDTHWYWDDAQEKAFCDVKRELSKSVVLAVYDPKKETVIQSM